ncbi:histidine kinase N-terminal domain-containing protein [Bacillus sp. 2205SS5-2]|uniref:histidine kinase N-terminal domain-containing protein n=1 Tax=Bacillus sp. 2205SS5-2 TaxID=3109031 RepID=UPI0030051BD9
MSIAPTNTLHFLEANRKQILENWSKKILVTNPTYEKNIFINGKKFFELLIQSFILSDEELEQGIKDVAKQVGEERITQNLNIGDVVHNINVGRNEIYRALFTLKEEAEVFHQIIEYISKFFDRFTYYAVTHYAYLKNEILQERQQYIDQQHQEQLSLLGQLTSSFVHEFRNPLTAVHGFIQLLKADYTELPYLNIISDELEQLTLRISQFLVLSKKGVVEKERGDFSMKELLNELVSFLYPRILEVNANIVVNIKDDLVLFGFKEEFRQVLLNLILNALDVLQNYRIDPQITINGVTNNKTIKLNISNNGPQIPPSQINKIFDPFMSSKEKGTGLGLFVCKEIVQKHRGTLSCTSKIEETTFKIEIPLHING